MISEITSIIQASKASISLLKEIKELIPENDKKSVNKKIVDLEKAFILAESATAKELGYDLCQCTFPPQIMRYQTQNKARVCPLCSHSRRKGSSVMFSKSSD